MKVKYLVLFITAFVGLTSCNDFLDIDPTDKATEKSYGAVRNTQGWQ